MWVLHGDFLGCDDLWVFRGPWHDVCRRPGLACNASASLRCRNEPEDGSDHGRLPDLVGLLRTFDFVAASNCVERDWNLNQFVECRRVLSLRE